MSRSAQKGGNISFAVPFLLLSACIFSSSTIFLWWCNHVNNTAIKEPQFISSHSFECFWKAIPWNQIVEDLANHHTFIFLEVFQKHSDLLLIPHTKWDPRISFRSQNIQTKAWMSTQKWSYCGLPFGLWTLSNAGSTVECPLHKPWSLRGGKFLLAPNYLGQTTSPIKVVVGLKKEQIGGISKLQGKYWKFTKR